MYGQIGNVDSLKNYIIDLTSDQISSNIQFAIGVNTFLLFSKNGNNNLYHLGKSDTLNNPACYRKPVFLKSNIQKISYNFDHALILTDNGDLYFYNNNDQFYHSFIPTLIYTNNQMNITIFETGDKFSIIYTNDSDIYKLTLENGNIKILNLTQNFNQITQGNKIVKISCGNSHTLVLLENNILFGFGVNLKGQLGVLNNFLDTNDFIEPNVINNNGSLFGKKILQITSGYEHSLILTENNEIFAFGDNTYGQIGSSFWNKNNSYLPLKVEFQLNYTILKIFAGYSISFLLTVDGEIYYFGTQYDPFGINFLTPNPIPTKFNFMN
jgi:alpha-tubulin suppressor-like RCC1 family protein